MSDEGKKRSASGTDSENASKNVSWSTLAGITFPAEFTHGCLCAECYHQDIGSEASVYLAAVLEFLTSEILRRACKVAERKKCTRIEPSHIKFLRDYRSWGRLLSVVNSQHYDVNGEDADYDDEDVDNDDALGHAANDGEQKAAPTTDYKIHIFRVLKQIQPDLGISKNAIWIMNYFVQGTLHDFATYVRMLGEYEGIKSVGSVEMESAVGRMLSDEYALSGELSIKAKLEGKKAAEEYAAKLIPPATTAVAV